MTTEPISPSRTLGRPPKKIPRGFKFRDTLANTAETYEVSVPTIRKWLSITKKPFRGPGNYSASACTIKPRYSVRTLTTGRVKMPVPPQFKIHGTVAKTALKYGVSIPTVRGWMRESENQSAVQTLRTHRVQADILEKHPTPTYITKHDRPHAVSDVCRVPLHVAKAWIASLQ